MGKWGEESLGVGVGGDGEMGRREFGGRGDGEMGRTGTMVK